jgi:hypothetical protein
VTLLFTSLAMDCHERATQYQARMEVNLLEKGVWLEALGFHCAPYCDRPRHTKEFEGYLDGLAFSQSTISGHCSVETWMVLAVE